MLDIKAAKLIQKALDEYYAPHASNICLEDICRMQPIPVTTKDTGYTILALQFGDCTLMVWVQFNETLGVCVRGVKTQSW